MILSTSDVRRVADSSSQGLIAINSTGHYFVDGLQQGFIAIGQNDAIAWPGLKSLLGRFCPQETEAYVADLRKHGINVSRIMMEYAQHPYTYLENPVGFFSPIVVQFWDDFFPIAERFGLYLLLTPFDTFWQEKNWNRYPYHKRMGGPCRTKRSWLTERNCIEIQKHRWEFVIQRWGNSPAIFAWDIMNEIDNCWGCTPREIDHYLTEMANFVRELELKYWGRSHLLTASTLKATPEGELSEVIYNHPCLDFVNTHLYPGPGVGKPMDAIACTLEIIASVRYALDHIRTPRPYFDSESGPITQWISDIELDKRYHHNMSWAHLATGAAGSGMRWPYSDPHCIHPELRKNLLGLSKFAENVDWANFDSRPLTIQTDADSIISTGCGDAHIAMAWLLKDTRQKGQVALDNLPITILNEWNEGLYLIEFWDTYAGTCIAAAVENASIGQLAFILPRFDQTVEDVALLIRPI
ncbi:MAG: cellulase family glycosylhydrolase [Anaerolineae bacterium]|nr:cellulase family glycosylhydrolase [Anaerolineae bacterium]